MSTALILVAAGRGTRAGGGVSKQFRLLAGVPVIRRSLDPFSGFPEISPVILVHPEGDAGAARDALGDENGRAVVFVEGGATRQASVLSGLRAAAAQGADRVLIHDAARPMLRAEHIAALLALPADASATLAAPVADSMRRATPDGGSEPVSREGLFAVQTPQLFPLEALLAAHERAMSEGKADFTDDCSLMQANGHAVTLVAGATDNFKITEATDFARAEAMLSPAPALPDVRVGHGYDIHVFGPGEHVTLCGVAIPHDRGLSGHSDADVGLHALTDALLATIGAGDIGTHFPPSDPQWRGAASTLFLAHAARLVAQAGGTITLADVTIVAEEPKVGPHRPAMTAAIAQALAIAPGRVSIKATTNERIGSIGRKEGICALATATVVFGLLAAG